MFRTLTQLAAYFDADPAAPAGGGGGGDRTVGPQGPSDGHAATEQASEAARAHLRAGGSLETFNPGGDSSHHSDRQPRTTTGQFDGAPAPAAPKEPASPQAPEPPKPPAEQTPAVEGEPQTEQQPDVAQDGEGAQVPSVSIPGTDEGEEALALEIEDPAVAEQLNARIAKLAEAAAQVSEIRGMEDRVMEEIEQLEDVRDQMSLDPAGYLLDMMPRSQEMVDTTIMFLLTQPEVWQRLQPRIAKLSNETELRVERAELQVARRNLQDKVRDEIADRRIVSRNAVEVRRAVTNMIPKGTPRETAELFFNDAIRDLSHHANSNRLKTIQVSEVPNILKKRAAVYGLDKPKEQPKPKGQTATVSTQKTGEEFVNGRRTKATLAAGGRAGAPAAAVAPPPGMSLKETSQWARDQIKGGRSLTGG